MFSTAVINVAPQSSGLNLGDVVSEYGSRAAVLCVGVANRNARAHLAEREQALAMTKDSLQASLDGIPVVGVLAFVNKYGDRQHPLGEDADISLQLPDYDVGRYRRSVDSVAHYPSVEHSSRLWLVPSGGERWLIRRVLAISEEEGRPLYDYLDRNRPGFWKSLPPSLLEGGCKYGEGIRRPVRQILAQYVGRTMRQHLEGGEVLLNVHLPVVPNVSTTLDVVVVAPVPALDDMIKALKERERAIIHYRGSLPVVQVLGAA